MNTKSYGSRSSRYRLKEFALTWGDLELGSEFLYIKKSAEVIVPRVTSEDCLYHTLYGLTTWEGLNLILGEIRLGA